MLLGGIFPANLGPTLTKYSLKLLAISFGLVIMLPSFIKLSGNFSYLIY